MRARKRTQRKVQGSSTDSLTLYKQHTSSRCAFLIAADTERPVPEYVYMLVVRHLSMVRPTMRTQTSAVKYERDDLQMRSGSITLPHIRHCGVPIVLCFLS